MANQTVGWTDKSIKALKPAKSRFVAWRKGGGGQGVRVATSGRKSFIFAYRYRGVPRMMTLGQYRGAGDLATANKAQVEAAEKLAKGIDPGAVLVKEKKEYRKSDTFADLAARYLKVGRLGTKKKPAREDTWTNAENTLKKHVFPTIGKKKARDVTRADIGKITTSLVTEGKRVQANRVLSWIKSVIKFGLGLYVNVTTPAFPAGEVRGQVLPPASMGAPTGAFVVSSVNPSDGSSVASLPATISVTFNRNVLVSSVSVDRVNLQASARRSQNRA